jgi:hypothetical protein
MLEITSQIQTVGIQGSAAIRRPPIKCLIAAAMLLIIPRLAMATQGHGGAEGLHVHQMSHLFFCVSMGILIYWLKARGLTREPEWRYIGIAALLFILWSLDAFTAHLLDEQLGIVQLQQLGGCEIQLDTKGVGSRFGMLYYWVKLDHLLCVPAIVFFYLGLRRLSKRALADQEEAGIKESGV